MRGIYCKTVILKKLDELGMQEPSWKIGYSEQSETF
jgi:hypothetical protein